MKHKQALSLLLSGIMTVSALGLPALATETADASAESGYTLLKPEKELALDGDTFKLQFKDIDWIMKKDNPTIKGGDRAIKSAEDAEDAMIKNAPDSDLVAEQMHQVRDQLISGAESLYITILKLENQKEDLLRQQKAVERKVRQAEIAYECGQISKLDLMQAQDGQLQLDSGMMTLNWTIMQMKEKLSVMLGKEPDTNLKLSAVELPPDFKMDYEKERKKAKHQNYDVKICTQKEVYGPGFWTQVKMTDAAEANFEADFRAVYRDTLSKQNALTLEQSKFTLAEENYQIAMLNYKHGVLSKSAMTDAEDTYLAADNALKNAELDAFAAQETYAWALAGVMNGQGGAQ